METLQKEHSAVDTGQCKIFRTISGFRTAGSCPVAFIGGSLTVGMGASNTTTTCWRRLLMKYFYENIVDIYDAKIAEINASIGAVTSEGSLFMLDRNVQCKNPTLVFIEQVVNDRTIPDKDSIKKSLEGIIRQIKTRIHIPDIVLLGGGVRPGTGDREDGLMDHSLHRELADHYGLAFIDVQDYMLKKLEERGETWADVTPGDWENLHVNDYGNRLWFECIRDWFEEQERIYEADPTNVPDTTLPPPLHSDEFQFTKLIDPTRRNKNITLEGNWKKGGEDVLTQWYIDDVLVGRPGDKLTFTFTGTAVGTMSHIYNNGLKIEAVLDGKEVPGPFTNHIQEFGGFHMIAHGMELGEHVLELTVGKPLKKQNRHEDPTARLAYIAIATGPE